MTLLKRGSKGEEVKTLQQALNVFADGIFGCLTQEAVVAFQKENGLVADGIVGDKTWAALQSRIAGNGSSPKIIQDGVVLKKSKRTITDIAIHCTATKAGQAITVGQIRILHIARGFSDIGYHYVIGIKGELMLGRDADIAGAHVAGHNSHSIGISYVGGLDAGGNTADTRTQAQKRTMKTLIDNLRKFYPNAVVKGHRDYSPDLNGDGVVEPWEWIKACPCFDAGKEYN